MTDANAREAMLVELITSGILGDQTQQFASILQSKGLIPGGTWKPVVSGSTANTSSTWKPAVTTNTNRPTTSGYTTMR